MSNRDRQRSGVQRPGAPSEQTPPERPAAGAELQPGSTAAAAGDVDDVDGNTELQEQAPPVDQAAAAPAGPAELSAMATLHGRLRTVENFLQQARGDQISLNEQVAELRRVVTQNADSLDAMAELIAGPTAPEAAAPEVVPPPEPLPPEHRRPRAGGQRTFVPTAPIAEPAPAAAPRALPPMRPAPARGGAPVATAEAGIPNQLDVGGELHIDPTKPGEHEIMTPNGPVLVRVRAQQRPGAFRRQGAGRVFKAPGDDQAGR